MKTFDKFAAQGDMMLIRIDVLPADAKEVDPVNGRHTLTHSETGHDHVVLERPGIRFFSAMDEFRSYLTVDGEPAELQHLRPFDTHESIAIPVGTYEVRRQREYVPEGYRRAAD